MNEFLALLNRNVLFYLHIQNGMKKFFFNEIKDTKAYILLLFAVLLLSFSTYLWLDREVIIIAGDEDGFFEYATAILFFVSSICMLTQIKKGGWVFFMLFLLLFVGAGEEISWGQRIFSIKTPEEIKSANVQGEMNIHNLYFFNRENFDQSEKTGWRKLITINSLYRIFIFSMGVLIPLIAFFVPTFKRFLSKLKVPTFPVTIGVFFILSWLFFKMTNYLTPPVSVEDNAAEEIFEYMTSWVWFCLAIYYIQFHRRIPPQHSSAKD